MKFKSLSTAKYLLLFLVAIASTSAYYGKKTLDQIPSAVSDAQAAQTAVERSTKTLEAMQGVLTPDEYPVKLDAAVSAAMLAVYNKRVEYRVSLAQVRVANASGGGAMAAISQFAEKVPGTQMQSVKVTVTGSYTDYSGLLGYLEFLRENHPLAVSALKVTDQTFELNIRIYGT